MQLAPLALLNWPPRPAGRLGLSATLRLRLYRVAVTAPLHHTGRPAAATAVHRPQVVAEDLHQLLQLLPRPCCVAATAAVGPAWEGRSAAAVTALAAEILIRTVAGMRIRLRAAVRHWAAGRYRPPAAVRPV